MSQLCNEFSEVGAWHINTEKINKLCSYHHYYYSEKYYYHHQTIISENMQ